MNYYPAFLNLNGKKTVVVGGGRVAERKVLSLLKSGASVSVISPYLTPRLIREKEKKNIIHMPRNYRRGDLRGCVLAFAATNDPSVNSRVASDAECPVNVADLPGQSSFIVPSVIRRGALAIAVSTGGASPAVSKMIRKELESEYGQDMARYLVFLMNMRRKALSRISDRKKRGRFLKALASGKMLNALRKQGLPAVRRSVEELFKEAV